MSLFKKRTGFVVAVMLAGFLITPLRAFAGPVLNFSDLDSGPSSGNSDGIGSGAIVTIWGNNLGSTQGASTVSVGGVPAAAVYYWKNADGTLPSGPADLYTSHQMQEIAFAVPATAPNGATSITVTVGGVASNSLPFTVRAGNIRFVKSGGSDSNAGTWSSPWATIGNSSFTGALDGTHAQPGDVVYSVGVGSTNGVRVGALSSVTGTATNPVALVTYPNTTVLATGLGGAGDGGVVSNWYPSNRSNQYITLSKLSILANGSTGNCNVDYVNGIMNGAYWKDVGIAITGPTVYGGYGGAIAGNGSGGAHLDGIRVLGAYIHNYGQVVPGWTYSDDSSTWTSPASSCYYAPYSGGSARSSVDRFQHLFYISNRTNSPMVGHEIAWGHYLNNPILHGLHIYDLSPATGGYSTPVMVHHNLIHNQGGHALDFTFPYASELDAWDNVSVTDPGVAYAGPAVEISGNQISKIYNNTFYNQNLPSQDMTASTSFVNNIWFDAHGVSYWNSNGPTSYNHNLFYSSYSSPPSLPSWYSTSNGDKNANPLFTNASGNDFSLASSSPASTAGTSSVLTVAPTDFLNQPRQSNAVSIGAFGISGNSGVTGLSAPPDATGSGHL